jgi:serine/threonine protein kinase
MEDSSIKSSSQASGQIIDNQAYNVKEEEGSLNCLELMDIEALVAAQDIKSNFGTDGHHLGRAGPADAVILGRGLSYSVTRISSREIMGNKYPQDRRLNTSRQFVVVKKPLIERKTSSGNDGDDDDDNDFQRRLYPVMLELRILHHKPVREHHNVVRLLEFIWDTQNHATKVAPSLILEYADLGTLSDFQDPERLNLRAATKIDICLDIAEGLSFLHKCGIIHGDVKSE